MGLLIDDFPLDWQLVYRFELELGTVAHVLNYLAWLIEFYDFNLKRCLFYLLELRLELGDRSLA